MLDFFMNRRRILNIDVVGPAGTTTVVVVVVVVVGAVVVVVAVGRGDRRDK